MPRATRDFPKIAGSGGHLLVSRFTARDDNGAPKDDPTNLSKMLELGKFFEIGRWVIRHKYILAPSTHSGLNGALGRTVVAQDFDVFLQLPWNPREAPSRDRESVGFMEELLFGVKNSDRNISIMFHMGDPLLYPDDNRAGYYHAPQVLLEEVETINDATGQPSIQNVVGFNIRMQGNSLIRGVRGLDIKFNEIDEPAEPPIPV